MIRIIRQALVCLSLLILPAGLAQAQKAPPPKPEVPALWQLELGKSRAYLFGTVHALPRGVDWFRPHVVSALDQSTRLVLETEVPDNSAAMMPVILKLTRLPAARPLPDRVPAEWLPTLNRALDRLKPGPLDWTKTWFVALTLSNLQAMADGVDPRIGVEAVLTERARMKGIPITALETAEEQLINFDALSEADQQLLLVSSLSELDNSRGRMSLLIGDWLLGNTDALADRVNSDFERSPMLKRMLVEDRNARWADWIAKQMKADAGPMFIAVGAGHMAGKGSLIEDLERQGIKVSRVVPAPPARRKKR
ncbi:TraB/GumN family protein [Sandaracinobacter sp.]|uniref:TraB/GumN family protein n=1 Tax=Sandaracinobacter sp. TaxID=2487581 RepID=UPI0035AE1027